MGKQLTTQRSLSYAWLRIVRNSANIYHQIRYKDLLRRRSWDCVMVF